ncbi:MULTISPECIES: hypothetical protein [unclassified Bartonella]|uniref:hypothetical protein n=1 Tax=unclassified Bartonella TaxID=2645622 RepID=UPI0035D07F03
MQPASLLQKNIFESLTFNKNVLLHSLNALGDFYGIEDNIETICINHEDALGDRINRIFSSVKCIFSQKNNHWFGLFYGLDKKFLVLIYDYLRTYSVHQLDGLYLLFEGVNVTTDNELVQHVYKFFDFIRLALAPNLLEGVDASEWRFKVMDTILYLIVFSSHYPENHARHLPLQDAIAFLIQPNFTFRKFANRQTNLIAPTARKRIRQAYAESGIYYNIPLAESLDHKSKYVKATDTKKILRWWKIDDEGR